MWDGIDCHRGRMLGWLAESVDDEPTSVSCTSGRMGSSQKGIWTGRVRSGFGQYFMGTSPLYYLVAGGLPAARAPRALRAARPCSGATSRAPCAVRHATRTPTSGASSAATSSCACCVGKREATRQGERGRAGRGLAGRATRAATSAGGACLSPAASELMGLSLRPRDHGLGGGPVLSEWCEGRAGAAHRHHRQRRGPVHDARDPELRDGLPRRRPDPGRRHVGGVDAPAGRHPASRSGYRGGPDGPAARGRRGPRPARLLPRAREEVVRRARPSAARASTPGSPWPGVADGYFTPAEQRGHRGARSAQAAPHLLFVGMPSPFKETWCERHRARLEVPVIMGVGGQLRRARRPRAPRPAPRCRRSASSGRGGCAMEPRKMWKRYLTTNTEFLWRASGEILSRAGPGALRGA